MANPTSNVPGNPSGGAKEVPSGSGGQPEKKPKQEEQQAKEKAVKKNPPATPEQLKKIKDEKESSVLAKTFSHFDGLSDSGAKIIESIIDTEPKDNHKSPDIGKALVKDVEAAVKSGVIGAEEGIKIIFQASGLYAQNPDVAGEFAGAIEEIVTENSIRPRERQQILINAAEQYAVSQHEGDFGSLKMEPVGGPFDRMESELTGGKYPIDRGVSVPPEHSWLGNARDNTSAVLWAQTVNLDVNSLRGLAEIEIISEEPAQEVQPAVPQAPKTELEAIADEVGNLAKKSNLAKGFSHYSLESQVEVKIVSLASEKEINYKTAGAEEALSFEVAGIFLRQAVEGSVSRGFITPEQGIKMLFQAACVSGNEEEIKKYAELIQKIRSEKLFKPQLEKAKADGKDLRDPVLLDKIGHETNVVLEDAAKNVALAEHKGDIPDNKGFKILNMALHHGMKDSERSNVNVAREKELERLKIEGSGAAGSPPNETPKPPEPPKEPPGGKPPEPPKGKNEAEPEPEDDDKKYYPFGKPDENTPSRLKSWMEKTARELRLDENKVNDVKWLERVLKEAEGLIHPSEKGKARLPGVDVEKVRPVKVAIEKQLQKSQKESLRGMPGYLKSSYEQNKKDTAQDNVDISNIVNRAKTPDSNGVRHELDPELMSLLEHIQDAIWNQNPNVHGLKELQLDLINRSKLTDAYINGAISAAIKHLEDRKLVYTQIEKLGEGYNRLGEAGIKNPTQQAVYAKVIDADLFFQELSTKAPDERQKYIDEFSRDVKDLATELLAIIRSDQTQFSENLFSPLIHEPIYNNIVTGLNRITTIIRQGEMKFANGAPINEATVKIEKYNYDEKRNNMENVRMDVAMSSLTEWVAAEKWWESYSHNVYVLHLTHQYDSFSKYAQQVEMNRISKILTENPELDTALNLHVAYVQAMYGLNGFRAPLDIYSNSNKENGVPVDEYVRQSLRNLFPDMQQKEIDRLVERARGIALGVTLEGTDIILSGGKPNMGPTEQFGWIGANPYITLDRFSQDTPFPMNEFLYTRILMKGGGIRIIAQEMGDAQALKEERKKQERSRFFTFDEIENQGICFMDGWDFLLQTGGFDAREFRWRGQEMYSHFNFSEIVDGKFVKPDNFRKLIIANPKYANSFLENAHFTGSISKEELYEWRKEIWKRIIKDIAPQAALVMDKSIYMNSKLDGFRTMVGAEENYNYSEKFINMQESERSEAILKQTILDAEMISQYLLTRDPSLNLLKDTGGGITATLSELRTIGADEDWINALFPSREARAKMGDAEVNARVRMAKKLMMTIRNDMADGLIDGDKSVTKFAWGEVAHIRSFPTAYRIRRDAKWEKSGDRTVGRLVNDAAALEKSWGDLMKKLQTAILTCQAEPQKFKDAHYMPFIEIIREWADAVKNVHGTSSDNKLAASVHINGYVFCDMVTRWFGRETPGRYLPWPLSYLTKLPVWNTSWSHVATGSEKADMEAQEVRALADKAVDMNLMANYLGNIMQKIEWKKFAGIYLPSYKMQNVKWGPFKFKWFANSPWNGRQFVHENGATNLHVAFDVGKDLIFALAFLILVSAFEKSQEDNK